MALELLQLIHHQEKSGVNIQSPFFRFSNKLHRSSLDIGWFMAELFMTWGLLGTLIGFTCLLPVFNSITSIDSNAILRILSKVGSGAGIALWTTNVGLVCSFLTKIQCFLLDKSIDDI